MGPIQPNCRHAIRATLLDGIGPKASFLRGLSAILRPPEGVSVVDYSSEILRDSGIDSPLDVLGLPQGRWIVCLENSPDDDFARGTPPIMCASILGLSSHGLYLPTRPLVWTQNRLSRAITLYKVQSFYDN